MNEPDDQISSQEDAEDLAEPLAAGAADLAGEDDDEDDGPAGPGLAAAVALDQQDLKGALESLILVSDKPIAAMRLARLTRQDLILVKQKLEELRHEYRGRGIVLDEIAGGFQFRTSGRFAPFVRNLVQQKPQKLSRAQLEVLAIIAYRQPVTRPELEDVRGVDSGSALKVLLERNIIKIIGKRDDVGRPMLYATTSEFLELFGLNTLRELPTLKEFAELTPESRDIYERRIGEPVPDQGMNLETHYEAGPARAEVDDDDPQGHAADAGPETDQREQSASQEPPDQDGAHDLDPSVEKTSEKTSESGA
jgi:segregation and condensation protein B